MENCFYIETGPISSHFRVCYSSSWESGRLRQGFVCERAGCLIDQITCLSGDCVTGTACDGSAQCNDVTDELKCGTCKNLIIYVSYIGVYK